MAEPAPIKLPTPAMPEPSDDSDEATPQKTGAGGRTVTFLTATSACPPRDYVLVFQHIRKTGGTSMKEIIAHNYRRAKETRVTYTPTDVMDEWWPAWAASLGEQGQDRLLTVSGHTASYALKVLGRPTRAITILRDPVDRLISRWYFAGAQRDEPFPGFLLDPLMHKSATEWFNPQSRSLLDGHYDTTELAFGLEPPPDADVWRERLFTILARHYLVGIQEAYDETIRMFGEALGWTDFRPSLQKVNATRPRNLKLSRADVELIHAANWLDVELYDHYAAGFRTRARQIGGKRARRAQPTTEVDPLTARGYSIREDRTASPAQALTDQLNGLRRQAAQDAFANAVRLRALEQFMQESAVTAATGIKRAAKRAVAKAATPTADKARTTSRAKSKEAAAKRSKAPKPAKTAATTRARPKPATPKYRPAAAPRGPATEVPEPMVESPVTEESQVP
jgi:hypothetical protein